MSVFGFLARSTFQLLNFIEEEKVAIILLSWYAKQEQPSLAAIVLHLKMPCLCAGEKKEED